MKLYEPRILSTLIALLLLLVPRGGLHAAQVLFSPELNLSEHYTSNIFLTPEDPDDDFITTAGLNLNLQALGRTTGMSLTLNPSYNAFADHTDFNYWRYAGNLHLWNDLARSSRLELINDYLETEDPQDQSADSAPDTPLDGPAILADRNRRDRNRYRTNISQGRFTHQFGARDNLYTTVIYTIHEEVDPPADQPVEDYTNLNPGLGIEYWFVPRWGISLDGSYSSRDYEDQNDRQEYTGSLRLQHAINQSLNAFVAYQHTVLDYDQNTDDDYQIYEPSVGISYEFEDTTSISISGGYYIQDFDQQDQNEEGWNVNSAIYKRWQVESTYADLTATSGYEIQDTGVQDLGLTIYYQGGLEVGYNFSPGLSANVFGSYRYDEYLNLQPERIDRTVTAGAGLTHQLYQWMEASLNYTYTDVTSDLETQEYNENSIILTLTLHPTVPYRLNQ